MVKAVGWSDVPDDVLAKIAKCLDSRIDVLRIRGVCPSWRSSLDRHMNIKTLGRPHTLLKLPGSSSLRIKRYDIQFDRKLSQTTVYRIKPKGGSKCPNSAPVWFLKVEDLEPNQMRILNPLSCSRGKCLPDSYPKVLNLLDYNVTEISKGYVVKDVEKSPCGISSFEMKTFSHKVVLYPDSIWTPFEELTIFMLRQKGNLYYCKHGDKRWYPINDKENKLTDIVVWRNQVFVVSRSAEVWTIDSSMKMVLHTPMSDLLGGSMNHLVVSNGQLHLVEKHDMCSDLSESDEYVEDTLDEEPGSSQYGNDVAEGKDDRDIATQSYEDDEDEIDNHVDDDRDTNNEHEQDEKAEDGEDDLKHKWVGMEKHHKGKRKRSHGDKWDEQDDADEEERGENGMKGEPIIVSRHEQCCFCWRNVLDINVYNLDEDLGWVEARNLGDQVWFMGYESFFCLPRKELPRFKGNCIYFLKQNLDDDYESDSDTGVRLFQMGKRRKTKMKLVLSCPGPALMFWPCAF